MINFIFLKIRHPSAGLEFFYKPHTLLLMFVCVVCITCSAFTSGGHSDSWHSNLRQKSEILIRIKIEVTGHLSSVHF